MPQGPKMFTCPKCRHGYLGYDPLPDCPSCGYDYRMKEGFRWDLLVYLLAIIALLSFLLVASHYRGSIGARMSATGSTATGGDTMPEKLPGSGSSRSAPFQSPYHESGT